VAACVVFVTVIGICLNGCIGRCCEVDPGVEHQPIRLGAEVHLEAVHEPVGITRLEIAVIARSNVIPVGSIIGLLRCAEQIVLAAVDVGDATVGVGELADISPHDRRAGAALIGCILYGSSD